VRGFRGEGPDLDAGGGAGGVGREERFEEAAGIPEAASIVKTAVTGCGSLFFHGDRW
jgi:hypothetical protein